MRLSPYLAYADDNTDEMPLYMFDKARPLPCAQGRCHSHLLWQMHALIIAWGHSGPAPLAMGHACSNVSFHPVVAQDFALAAPQLLADYEVPPYFADDLFAALGEDERPDYRWLIVGPRRSGSSFHVDPNATSAWNAGAACHSLGRAWRPRPHGLLHGAHWYIVCAGACD